MALTKGLGTIYDTEEAYINLPLKATVTGRYRIMVKPPTAARFKQRLVDVTEGDFLKVPNYNGKKTLGYGENIFYVFLPDNERLQIADVDRWTVRFKEIKVTSNFTVKSFLFKDGDKHYAPYMQNGDLHIVEVDDLSAFEDPLIISNPFL